MIRYRKDGLPVNPDDWGEDDWLRLQAAIRGAIKEIQDRHKGVRRGGDIPVRRGDQPVRGGGVAVPGGEVQAPVQEASKDADQAGRS